MRGKWRDNRGDRRYTVAMANKEQRRNKEKKKPAQKSLKEKRAEKRAKKMGAM